MRMQRVLLRISRAFVWLLQQLVPVLHILWKVMLILVIIALLLLLAVLFF